MYIQDVLIDYNHKKEINTSYIYGFNWEIWKILSDIKIEMIDSQDWNYTINFLLNWEIVWFIVWILNNGVFFIDEFSTINLNVWWDKFYKYSYFERKLSQELISKIKIKNLWTNMIINFIVYIINHNKTFWIEYIEFFPTKTSREFYIKIKDLLLELWIIKWFNIEKIKVEWESPSEYFRFYI